MNLKTLLAAASIVALTVTSAHAGMPTTPVVPALELDTVQPNANTDQLFFVVMPTTGTTFPGGVVLIDITLPAGTIFAQASLNSDATGIGGGMSTSTVQSGGAIGTDTVTFAVDFPSAGATGISLSGLDLKLNGCPAGVPPLTVSASQGGQAIGVADIDVDTVTACKTAFTSKVKPATSTVIAGPTYTSLSATQLGTVDFGIDSAVARSYNRATVTASDVTSATFDVIFQNATGFAGLELQLTCGSKLAGVKTGNIFTFTATTPADVAGLLDISADSLVASTAGNTTALSAQTITVGSATLTLNDTNANFLPTATVAGGTLIVLQRDGDSFGPFDWNSTSTTNSIYRVTGLPKTGTTGYSVTLTNTQPADAAGTYSGGEITTTDGETILTSFTKFGVASVPNFRRADVEFNFEVATTILVKSGSQLAITSAIDVDRLLLRSDTLTSFGNETGA